MSENPLLDDHWYYIIEYEDGKFTPGMRHSNLALTRRLLRNVDVCEVRCLDVGTQEGVIPILLDKAGAGQVAAYDRFNSEEKINWLKRIYGVTFDYYPGMQLVDLPGALDAKDERFFDLVVFSGALYHMVNPLGLLALVRGLCRVGGLFVLETAAVNQAETQLIFNAQGRAYGPGSSYFLPTTGWLDYVLRMLGMRPLHATFAIKRDRVIRVALLCRSEATPCPADADDKWVSAHFHKAIFRDECAVDWDSLLRTRSSLSYAPFDRDGVSLADGSLYDNLAKAAPYRYDSRETMLFLDSTV